MDMSSANVLDLPPDLQVLIAKHVTDIKDFVRARAVCHMWESIFSLQNFTPLSQEWLPVFEDHHFPHCETPWLMLAEREDSDIRSFFNPATSEVYDIPLPEIWQRRISGSAHGWLVTIGLDMEIHLFNPLTRTQLKLPPQAAFGYEISEEVSEDCNLTYLRDKFLPKVILNSSPYEKDFMVIASYSSSRLGAVARPGDKFWTTFGGSGPGKWRAFKDFIHYRGNIYAVTNFGMFARIDISSEQQPVSIHKLGYLPTLQPTQLTKWSNYAKYLVELSGDLLFVARNTYSAYEDSELGYDSDDRTLPEVVIPYKSTAFKVYKLDQWLPELKWVELKDLGDYALFLGQNSSFSVKEASQPGAWWRRNCIYFTDDGVDYFWEPKQLGGHDQGVYNLEDGSFQPHYQGSSCSFHSPPVWFTPSLY